MHMDAPDNGPARHLTFVSKYVESCVCCRLRICPIPIDPKFPKCSENMVWQRLAIWLQHDEPRGNFRLNRGQRPKGAEAVAGLCPQGAPKKHHLLCCSEWPAISHCIIQYYTILHVSVPVRCHIGIILTFERFKQCGVGHWWQLPHG